MIHHPSQCSLFPTILFKLDQQHNESGLEPNTKIRKDEAKNNSGNNLIRKTRDKACFLFFANHGNYIRMIFCFPGFKRIPLDALVDTGSTRSLAKINAIPLELWEPQLDIPNTYAINGEKRKMGRYAQDVHIEIMGKMFVTDFIEYNDLDDDVLLGYLFITKYQPLQF